jgi:hypothetical protein
MFCPKCGIKNPDTGKYCRKCGTDLGNVHDFLSGNLSKIEGRGFRHHNKGKSGWESAMGSLFMGLAFLCVSLILGFTGKGNDWWFWMLIPAFGMIGAGVSKIIVLKQNAKQISTVDLTDDTKQISSQQRESLPPKQTEFVSNMPDSKFKTGDLVPPSVVEYTTRRLKVDSEGKTKTLSKDED